MFILPPESAVRIMRCLSCQIDSRGTGNRNAPRAGYLPLLILRTWLSRARSPRADFDARQTLNNSHRRCVGAERALPGARCAPPAPRGTAHRCPRSALQPRMFFLFSPPVVLTGGCVGHAACVCPAARSVRRLAVSHVHCQRRVVLCAR